jgi:hypothetical protein
MTIITQCPDCDQRLRIADSLLGRTVTCPRCATAFRASEAPQPRRTTSSLPASPGSRPRREDDFTDEPPEERDRPRRRKGSGSFLRVGITMALGALVLVGGLIVALVYYLNRGIPEAEWKSFSPEGMDCTLLMPGNPERKDVDQPTPAGLVRFTQYTVERDRGQALFGVACSNISAWDFPRIPLTDRFQGCCEGMRANLPNSRLLRETNLELNGQPGKE